MSACATVDITSLGNAAGEVAVSSAPKKNVVQRAAGNLYVAFINNGWSEKASKKRIQSTAHILLKGLEPQTEAIDQTSYISSLSQKSQLIDDVKAAESYILQLSKAAEVYIAMANQETMLQSELSSLEKALIAARHAQVSFQKGFEVFGTTENSAFLKYEQSVDRLRDITNEYGQHLRNSSKEDLGSI